MISQPQIATYQLSHESKDFTSVVLLLVHYSWFLNSGGSKPQILKSEYHTRDWRDGPAFQSIGFSSRRPSTHMAAHNVSSRESNTFFWPPWVLNVWGEQIHTQTKHPSTWNRIKIFFLITWTTPTESCFPLECHKPGLNRLHLQTPSNLPPITWPDLSQQILHKPSTYFLVRFLLVWRNTVTKSNLGRKGSTSSYNS